MSRILNLLHEIQTEVDNAQRAGIRGLHTLQIIQKKLFDLEGMLLKSAMINGNETENTIKPLG